MTWGWQLLAICAATCNTSVIYMTGSLPHPSLGHLLGKYDVSDQESGGRKIYTKATEAGRQLLWYSQGTWWASIREKWQEPGKGAPALGATSDAISPELIPSGWQYKSETDGFSDWHSAPEVKCQSGEAGVAAVLETMAAPSIAFYFKLDGGLSIHRWAFFRHSRSHRPSSFKKIRPWFGNSGRHVYETRDGPLRMLWYANDSWYVGDPAAVGTVPEASFTASFYRARDDALLPEDLRATWQHWSNSTWEDVAPMRAAGGADGEEAMVKSALLALRYELTSSLLSNVDPIWALTRLNEAYAVGASLVELDAEVKASKATSATLVNVSARLATLVKKSIWLERAGALKEVPQHDATAKQEKRAKEGAVAETRSSTKRAEAAAREGEDAMGAASKVAESAEQKNQAASADRLKGARRSLEAVKENVADAKRGLDRAERAREMVAPAADGAKKAKKMADEMAAAEAAARTAKVDAEVRAAAADEADARADFTTAEAVARVAREDFAAVDAAAKDANKVAKAATAAFAKAAEAAKADKAPPKLHRQQASAKAKMDAADKQAMQARNKANGAAAIMKQKDEASKTADGFLKDKEAARMAVKATADRETDVANREAAATKRAVTKLEAAASNANQRAIRSAKGAKAALRRAQGARDEMEAFVRELEGKLWFPDWEMLSGRVRWALVVMLTLVAAWATSKVSSKLYPTRKSDPEEEELKQELREVAARYERENSGDKLQNRDPKAVPEGKFCEKMKFAPRDRYASKGLRAYLGFEQKELHQVLGGDAPITSMLDEWKEWKEMCDKTVRDATENKRSAEQARGTPDTEVFVKEMGAELEEAKRVQALAADDYAALQYVTKQRAGDGTGCCKGFDCDPDGVLLNDRRNDQGLGKNLADFVKDANDFVGRYASGRGHNAPSSAKSSIEEFHVAALRLYTTCAYAAINEDLRSDEPVKHFKFTVYFIAEALIKLRNANRLAPPVDLYRGVRDREFEKDFKDGVELGLMSTTSDLYTAITTFADSKRPILLRLRPSGNEHKGSPIGFLSVYPAEAEYLYPPLTTVDRKNLQIREIVIGNENDGNGGFAITVVDLEPTVNQLTS